MKTVTAAFTKKAVSNAKGGSITRAFFRYCCWNKVFLASIRASGGAVENHWVRTGKLRQKQRWCIRSFAI